MFGYGALPYPLMYGGGALSGKVLRDNNSHVRAWRAHNYKWDRRLKRIGEACAVAASLHAMEDKIQALPRPTRRRLQRMAPVERAREFLAVEPLFQDRRN